MSYYLREIAGMKFAIAPENLVFNMKEKGVTVVLRGIKEHQLERLNECRRMTIEHMVSAKEPYLGEDIDLGWLTIHRAALVDVAPNEVEIHNGDGTNGVVLNDINVTFRMIVPPIQS